jgi:hypothetical protein
MMIGPLWIFTLKIFVFPSNNSSLIRHNSSTVQCTAGQVTWMSRPCISFMKILLNSHRITEQKAQLTLVKQVSAIISEDESPFD